MSSDPIAERRQLRQLLRARRAALSGGYRQRAARQIHAHIATTTWLHPGATIGLYVDVVPEVATKTLRLLAQRRGCIVALPRIQNYRERRMTLNVAPPASLRNASLRANRFGIGEPPAGQAILAGRLSVLFLPVLGFDVTGTRLGSGSGYYDRLLAWRLRTGRHAARPVLVGIAYDCALLAHVPRAAHDVPLDAVVTESGIRHFAGRPT